MAADRRSDPGGAARLGGGFRRRLGDRLPTTHEGNLDVIYNVPQVKGLSLRFRNAYVGRGNASVLRDYRIIINYELDLL